MLQGAAGLLIAAAVGYLVIERADRHKGSLRRIGYLVGGVIVVSSIIGLACKVSCMASGGSCGMMKKGAYCPMTGKGM